MAVRKVISKVKLTEEVSPPAEEIMQDTPQKEVSASESRDSDILADSRGPDSADTGERLYVRPAHPQRDYGARAEMHENTVPVSGILDIQHEGHGFLRPKFRASDRDIYISASQIRRFGLGRGIWLRVLADRPKTMRGILDCLRLKKLTMMILINL